MQYLQGGGYDGQLIIQRHQDNNWIHMKVLEEASGLFAWETGQDKLRQAVKDREMVVVDDMDQSRVSFMETVFWFQVFAAYGN